MYRLKQIDWSSVKVVIFDVDGTLYDQSRMRKFMFIELLKYYGLRPWMAGDVMLLSKFRAEREKRAGYGCQDLSNAQYYWCAKNISTGERIQRIVTHWINRFPLRYMHRCRYPGVKLLFDSLREQGIKIGIFSDYPASDKLEALGLEADLIISSTDTDVNYLKPDPKGLNMVAEKLNVDVNECLFIGDRQELDGVCAERAGMPYLIVGKGKEAHLFYDDLLKELNISFTTKFELHENDASTS